MVDLQNQHDNNDEHQSEDEENAEVPGPGRVFEDRLDPLNISDNKLLRKYRLRRHIIIELIDLLRPDIERITDRSHAIPVYTIVLSGLRLLATGSFQSVIGDTVGISQSSVSRTFKEFLQAMLRRGQQFIQCNLEDAAFIQRSQEEFFNIMGMPGVFGLIDGTQIFILTPKVNGIAYLGRKQHASINTQLIVGSRRQILDVVAKYPGSCHDSRIWMNCGFRQKLYAWNGDGKILGDPGYPLEMKLITPIRNPVTIQEQNFNHSHKVTRSRIENVNGILKNTFRAIDRSGGCLLYDPPVACQIITVCCQLYNLRLMHNLPEINVGQHVNGVGGDLDSDDEPVDEDENDPQLAVARQVRDNMMFNFPNSYHI